MSFNPYQNSFDFPHLDEEKAEPQINNLPQITSLQGKQASTQTQVCLTSKHFSQNPMGIL